MQKQAAHNYTGYGWEGKNYKSGMTTTEIAAEIRKIVRKLWPTKEGFRISVTRDYFSMGSSIDVKLKAAPFKIYRPAYSAAYASDDRNAIEKYRDDFVTQMKIKGVYDRRLYSIEYTDEAFELITTLEKLGNSFRRDDSDGMIDYFDTNFYLHAGVDWQVSKES